MARTSRVLLQLHVLWVRGLTRLASVLDRYYSHPRPPQPSFKTKISSTTSHQRGSIELLFYTPTLPNSNVNPRPVVINFHGGGWIFGSPQMDARWAARVIQTGAVFVSVGYRLAPEHPFPTPLEDCVDAINWIYRNAERYEIDSSRIALSGFSAGGNLVFAAAMKLHEEVADPIKLTGIISFYPLLDRTRAIEEKYARSPIAAQHRSTPKSWDKLFVDSYLGSGPIDLSSQYLSPGLAPDHILKNALPQKIAIYTCGWDALLDEGETFRQRLGTLLKTVGGSTVEGVSHAWDRLPQFSKGNPKMDDMYTMAINNLEDMYRRS